MKLYTSIYSSFYFYSLFLLSVCLFYLSVGNPRIEQGTYWLFFFFSYSMPFVFAVCINASRFCKAERWNFIYNRMLREEE